MRIVEVLVLLMVVLLPANGSAQEYYTIPELRDQAAAGWHANYTDAYGRNIRIDTDVEVFGEELAPVLKVDYADYRANAALFEEGTKVYDHVLFGCALNNPHESITHPKEDELTLNIHHSYCEKVDMDKAYGTAYGSNMTLQGMVDYLCEILDRHGVLMENFVYDQPREFKVWCKVRKDTGEILEPAFFDIALWPQMHGMPILTHAIFAFERSGWPSYQPELRFALRAPDEFTIFIDTVKEVEMLADDIPLCSLEQVIKNLEDAIKSGFIRKVFDLQFGFALYNDPNFPKDSRSTEDAECYYAVPSWVAHCIFIDNPKADYSFDATSPDDPNRHEELAAEYKTVVINAQTGKLLDRFDKSKDGWGDADYQGFVSWEDVK